MKKKKRRIGESVAALAACAAILLLAWGVAMAVALAFSSAWVRDPMPEVTRRASRGKSPWKPWRR